MATKQEKMTAAELKDKVDNLSFHSLMLGVMRNEEWPESETQEVIDNKEKKVEELRKAIMEEIDDLHHKLWEANDALYNS